MNNKLRVILALAALHSVALGQNWTPPERGWLYVLDVDDGRGPGGRILLVDPKEGVVKGSLPTDYHPIFGLCPDGSRLYVLDGPQSLGSFSIFDTQTGRLLSKTPFPNLASYTISPAFAGIGCSTDGHWVFIQTARWLPEQVDEHRIVVINANTGELVANAAAAPNCGIAQFIPWPFGLWDIVARCSATNTLHFVAVAANGSVARTKDVSLPLANMTKPDGIRANRSERVATSAVLDPGRRAVGFFRSGGGIDQLDPLTLQFQTKSADTWERWMPTQGATAFKSGLYYVGFLPYHMRGNPSLNNIAVFRTADWAEITSFSTVSPFWSLAIGSDEQVLYAANPESHSIALIDTSSKKEIGTISVGQRPSLILVQP